MLIDLKVQVAELKVQVSSLEKRIDEIEKRNEQRYKELKSDIKDQNYLIMSGFAAVIGFIGGLIAIIYWDRRTFVKPLETKVTPLEIKTEILGKHSK